MQHSIRLCPKEIRSKSKCYNPYSTVLLIPSSFDSETRRLEKCPRTKLLKLMSCLTLKISSESSQEPRRTRTEGNALGTVAQLRRTSVPSQCTPDVGPGTSAQRLLKRGLGYVASYLYRIRAVAPNGTRRLYGDQPPETGGPETDCATGVVAGVDFVGVVPRKVQVLVTASDTFTSPLVFENGSRRRNTFSDAQHSSPSHEIRKPSYLI